MGHASATVGFEMPPGSMVLTPTGAQILYQVAHLGELREKHRLNDTEVSRLLLAITRCAFSADIAAPGNETRQSAAKEERGHWTVNQLAKATRRATRTVRLDIEQQQLPAAKISGTWLITPRDAETYINIHRK